jgi:hypothetical protein
VIGILIDGSAAETVSVAAIIAPGQERAKKRTLRTGTLIEQGSGMEWMLLTKDGDLAIKTAKSHIG